MNGTHQLLIFGFILLPKKYEVERDIVVTFIGILSIISLIANLILLFVIVKDPFKQLRSITALLLAFNALSNVVISLILLINSIFLWSNLNVFPEMVIYLGSCSFSLYFIGSTLHSINIFGTIVFPVRYAYLAPKVLRLLPYILFVTATFIAASILIPLYTLNDEDAARYVKGIITFLCVQLALLIAIVVYLYFMIFKALFVREQTLSLTFNIKRSTRQATRILKRNYEVAKTLFIHVASFLLTAIPVTIVVMMSIYCKSCGSGERVQLASLIAIPGFYISFVFHPFLWLYRLKPYKSALKQSFRVTILRARKVNGNCTKNGHNNNCIASASEGKHRSATLTSTL